MEAQDENNDDDGNDDPEFDAKLEFFGQKEEMMVMLDNYKENMETKINQGEKVITQAIKKEWEAIEERVVKNQHQRNRSIVKEIIETAQDFKANLKDQFDRMREEYENE
jgi:hypothetical protein